MSIIQHLAIFIFQGVPSNGSVMCGGICVIFDDSRPKIVKTVTGSQIKLTPSNVDLLAVVTGLESARERANKNVEIRTASRILHDIFTKWLVIWKKNKWKKGNGSRLTIPIQLLRRLDNLLKVDKHCPQQVKHFFLFLGFRS